MSCFGSGNIKQAFVNSLDVSIQQQNTAESSVEEDLCSTNIYASLSRGEHRFPQFNHITITLN